MNQNFKLKESGQIKYFKCRELDDTNLVTHAFTTRAGGVSNSPFNSLNMSYNVNDNDSYVSENRKIILTALEINFRDIVAAQQVHKDNISIVEKGDKGKGALRYSDGIAESDALITNISGIPLLMCYADCVPIFILDPIKKVIALIHSGKKGTELELTWKTLSKMQQIYGTNTHSCIAAIFPSVGVCCYKINELNLKDNYTSKNKFSGKVIFKKNNNEFYLDLKKANYLQLIRGKVDKKNIFISEICTVERPDLFFSYRRDKGNTGRMAAIFMLKK